MYSISYAELELKNCLENENENGELRTLDDKQDDIDKWMLEYKESLSSHEYMVRNHNELLADCDFTKIFVIGSTEHLEKYQQLNDELMQVKEQLKLLPPNASPDDVKMGEYYVRRAEAELRWITPDEVLTDSLWMDGSKEQSYLIDGLIPQKSIGEIFGASGHHKTFIVLDMLFCIAHGLPYHGRTVQQGTVIYMCGEGRNGIISRLNALSEHYGVAIDTNAFLVPKFKPDLMSDADMDKLGKRLLLADDAKIIVFDTMPSYVSGIDMSSSLQWSTIKGNFEKYLKNIDVVAWVAHTNLKEKNRSGGTGQRSNDSDFVLKVEKKTNGDTLLTSTKMKDAEKPEAIVFKMKGVAGSLVPILKTDTPLNANEKAVLKKLGKDVVTQSEFNSACEAVLNPDGTKKQTTVTKARKRLLDNLLIKEAITIEK